MKNRIALFLAVVLIFSTLLGGCGSKEKGEDNSSSLENGPWYKAQYHDYTLGENEFVADTEIYEDTAYMIVQNYHEETQSITNKLQKMSLKDFKAEQVELEIEEEYNIADMFVNDSGIYYVLQYIKWNNVTNKVEKTDYKLVHCDLEGKVVQTFSIAEDLLAKSEEDMPAYVAGLVVDNDGNMIITNSESFIIAYDHAGKKVVDISLQGYGNGLIKGADGTVYYSYMDDMSWETVFAPVDIKGGKLGEKVTGVEIYNSGNIYIDSNNKLWMTDGNDLITFDMKSEEKNKVLNWLDYDINGNDIRMFYIDSDGTYVAYTESYAENAMECEWITLEESEEPLTDKIVLTYATFGTDSDVTDAIIRFNKNNETYRIQVVDYYNNEDYEAGMNAYDQAILKGDMADIINVDWSQYKSYARKGLYEDLNVWMDSDKEIDKKDYFENVIKAYEVDGKLCAVPLSFTVSTLTGKTSVWGEESGITMQKVADVMRDLPKDVTLLDYTSKMYWLTLSMQGAIENFVDWETGECFFDSEEFITMLEVANQFPEEPNYDEQELSTPEKVQLGKVLLFSEYYSDITGYQVTKEIFQDDITAVGYPGVKGNGAILQNSGSLLAISKQSEYKDGAWEFVKYMMSEEYQSNYIRYDNPIHKSAFEKQMAEAAKAEYYKNEKGEEVESPKMTYGWGDNFEVSVYHATEEDIKEYRELLEGATVLASYDEEIMSMIEEEVEPFFAGKKSAKDVANIIQGRVKIYVNENR